jgi:DnaJ-class molecular chaperone
MIACPNCNGKGEVEGPKWTGQVDLSSKKCPTCKGDRKVPNYIGEWVICPVCLGWGNEPPQRLGFICSKCNGVGMLPT